MEWLTSSKAKIYYAVQRVGSQKLTRRLRNSKTTNAYYWRGLGGPNHPAPAMSDDNTQLSNHFPSIRTFFVLFFHLARIPLAPIANPLVHNSLKGIATRSLRKIAIVGNVEFTPKVLGP